MSSPWLSVITAVKDDPKGLARTIDSLREQDLSNVEILVIDGSHHRQTVEEIGSPVATINWEPPTGIYPAMNSGLHRAQGTFVSFLNAGDRFHSPDVLSRVRTTMSESCTWAFGPVALIGRDGATVVTPPWDYSRERDRLFSRGFFPQHQGVFTRREVLSELGGFSSDYRIAADYHSFLLLSKRADPCLLDFVVADFHEGGVSTTQWRESFREFHRARRSVFEPRGMLAAREQWNTAVHFTRVWVYRDVVLPLRRLARR